MNIALMLGEITERENNMPLPNVVDAELTIEKPFIFWIIAISERVDLPMVRYIEQGRNRAQSFKHPFRLAFTSSEAINVLFSFLLTKVTEITTTPRLPAK
jgi:hypothetical protein